MPPHEHLHVDLEPQRLREAADDLLRLFAAWPAGPDDPKKELFFRELGTIVTKIVNAGDRGDVGAAIGGELYGFALVARVLHAGVKHWGVIDGAAVSELDDLTFTKILGDMIEEELAKPQGG